MQTVEVSHVAKSIGHTQAVADVSFAADPGEIFLVCWVRTVPDGSRWEQFHPRLAGG